MTIQINSYTEGTGINSLLTWDRVRVMFGLGEELPSDLLVQFVNISCSAGDIATLEVSFYGVITDLSRFAGALNITSNTSPYNVTTTTVRFALTSFSATTYGGNIPMYHGTLYSAPETTKPKKKEKSSMIKTIRK